MSRVSRGVTNLLLAVLIGGAAGFGGVQALTAWREHQISAHPGSAVPEPGDRVLKAVTELRKDGVYVAPDARHMIRPAGERRVEKAVARSPTAMYVIVWSPSRNTGSDSFDVEQQLMDEFGGQDGLIFVWEGPEKGSLIEIGGSPYVTDPEIRAGQLDDSYDFVGDPATALIRGIESVHDPEWEEPYAPSGDYWGGVGGGIAAGAMFGVGALAVLWALTFLIRLGSGGRWRLAGGWTWTK